MKTFIINNWQQVVATGVTAITITFNCNPVSAQLLRGAGASFPQSLYERYQKEYEQETGNKFEYNAIGSGGGIRFFSNQSKDFGSSTLIPTPIEQNQMKDGLLMVPTGGSALAIVYNLKDTTSDVRLSRDTLAKIFTGEIANWQQVNSRLPNKKIQVVVRSNSSGTSFILSKYLQAITNGKISASRQPNWGFEVFAQYPGDSGVAGEVRRTDGAIGYVQASIARKNNLSVARIENQSGRYIRPTLEETKKALANVKFKQDFTAEDINDPKDGYPLVSLTWLLFNKRYSNQEKLAANKELLTWIVTKGQNFNEDLEYTKIPEDVAKKVIETANNELKVRSYSTGASNSQPQVSQTRRFRRLNSQTQTNYRIPYFGENIDNRPPYFGEVINVYQLEDVSPEHWAYQALRSLVEKYRCITDSKEGAFNGNRVINRYEFAAALNTCVLKIRRSIYSLGNRLSEQKEDLAIIQRLQTTFAKELETITTKIDNLEERVTFLKDNQFSTTTVLRGRVDFNFISAFGNRKAVPGEENPTEDLDEIPTLSARTTLSFDTSFTGKDRLRARIQAGNISNFGSSVTGTDMTRLIGATNTGNDIKLGTLFYEFPIGKRGIVAIAPAADFPTRIFPALNPVSSISNFGGESPIYSFAFGAGAVAYYQFTDELAAGVSYLTFPGNNPEEGLFNGQFTALTQVTYTPSDKVGIALTYGRYYAPDPVETINVTGSKGSNFAQLPFGGNTATSSDALGLQFTYKLSDKLTLGGWGSYFNANAEASPSVSGFSGSSGSDADIWSWAVTASLKDLGKLGSQLSFVFGMPPKVTNNDVLEREDKDTSLHFELSYRYPLTDRIFITPGFLVITNPEHNANNDTTWVGLMRTSFSF